MKGQLLIFDFGNFLSRMTQIDDLIIPAICRWFTLL